MNWAERLTLYEKLMRLDKPIGILLLLWPTLWGVWIASDGKPDGWIVWIFVLGTVLTRSAGCVVNDFADRNIDPHVVRTKDRPLATRKVSEREALLLAAGLALLAFLLILPLHPLVWGLSVVAVVIATIYPFTKRFLPLPQAWLGLAFSFGIPMAFAAVWQSVPPVAWGLMLSVFFWTIAYDTEYAMVDRDDDLKIGIRTSAITFGRYDVTAVMVCYVLMLVILVGVGLTLKMRMVYYFGLGAAAGVMVYHYVLIRMREKDKCFRAFLHNNWVGAAVFAGIVGDFWLR